MQLFNLGTTVDIRALAVQYIHKQPFKLPQDGRIGGSPSITSAVIPQYKGKLMDPKFHRGGNLKLVPRWVKAINVHEN
jgi:hypothetical protein